MATKMDNTLRNMERTRTKKINVKSLSRILSRGKVEVKYNNPYGNEKKKDFLNYSCIYDRHIFHT